MDLRPLAERTPGLRRVRRPASDLAPAFDLAYLRCAPEAGAGAGAPVVLEIAGGPGLAVPLAYRRFRARAAAAGLDVIMLEHRGVGLSRTDLVGRDLPPSAISVAQVVEDLVAVLEAEGIERAIVSGASYGSYVAAALALAHPERVSALVLDSPVLGAGDYREVRAHSRRLLWHGRSARHPQPGVRDEAAGSAATERIARKVRVLVERDHHAPLPLGAAVSVLFDAGGPELTEQYLDQLVVGRAVLTRALLSAITEGDDVPAGLAHVYEPDLVAPIAYGELNYASPTDGGIFDPGHVLGFPEAPPFTGESLDLPADLARIDLPAVVISGDRDLQTPRPIAEAAARALPQGILLRVPGHGHSALDSRPRLLIAVLRALARGEQDRLPHRIRGLAAHSGLSSTTRLAPLGLRAVLAADRVLRPFPRRPPSMGGC